MNINASFSRKDVQNEVIGSAALCYGTGVKRFDLF